jgi:IS30 family transposase
MECMRKGTRYAQLSYEERVTIAALRERGESVRSIARAVGRSPNTVSRELREKRVKGRYVPRKAQHRTYWRRYRSKRGCMKVAVSRDLTDLVNEKLPLGWSPERVAGYATRQGMPVSKKAVYRYVTSRCLERHLFWRRNRKKSGRKRSHRSPADVGRRMVAMRPPVRSSGHWELDFLVSSLSGAVLMVMVDRWTRYTVLELLKRKTHALVARALADVHRRYDVATITTDNDIVFQTWREMEDLLPSVRFFFCRPYHSWEKGLVENTNRWIRTFIPKKTDLAAVSRDTLRSVALFLNETPRQCLGCRTAKEVLFANQTNQVS